MKSHATRLQAKQLNLNQPKSPRKLKSRKNSTPTWVRDAIVEEQIPPTKQGNNRQKTTYKTTYTPQKQSSKCTLNTE